jgi:hypothetical protein
MVLLRFAVALVALCIVSNGASASSPKPHESSASDFSSRQRCVCSTLRRATHVVGHRHYRVRTAYLIGYDPLPYRFGSTFVWERPYRYYRH